jgi:hypothetical protein
VNRTWIGIIHIQWMGVRCELSGLRRWCAAD